MFDLTNWKKVNPHFAEIMLQKGAFKNARIIKTSSSPDMSKLKFDPEYSPNTTIISKEIYAASIKVIDYSTNANTLKLQLRIQYKLTYRQTKYKTADDDGVHSRYKVQNGEKYVDGTTLDIHETVISLFDTLKK
ncbi:MAG: hypothetical protein WC758_03170 [Candidatus Woesearchaeota archaeon]|jgi:hypothetical protein